MQQVLRHPQYDGAVSVQKWNGSQPCRFKGGRKHNNHPPDQLDNILIGSNYTVLFEDKGKYKQYKLRPSLQPDPLIRSRSSIRTFNNQYQKCKIFQTENIPKLIKLDRNKQTHDNAFTKYEIHKTNLLGYSKMKQLQTGNKKTGIYRNFYKSQTKSAIGMSGQEAIAQLKSLQMH